MRNPLSIFSSDDALAAKCGLYVTAAHEAAHIVVADALDFQVYGAHVVTTVRLAGAAYLGWEKGRRDAAAIVHAAGDLAGGRMASMLMDHPERAEAANLDGWKELTKFAREEGVDRTYNPSTDSDSARISALTSPPSRSGIPITRRQAAGRACTRAEDGAIELLRNPRNWGRVLALADFLARELVMNAVECREVLAEAEPAEAGQWLTSRERFVLTWAAPLPAGYDDVRRAACEFAGLDPLEFTAKEKA